MFVRLGNARPLKPAAPGSNERQEVDLGAPIVTYMTIPDELYGIADDADTMKLMRHLVANPDITNLGDDNEKYAAPLLVVHGSGLWNMHGRGAPTWVDAESLDNPSQAEAMKRFLSEWYECPAGAPADLEDTHFTMHGSPGVPPGAILDVDAIMTKAGEQINARALGGGFFGVTGTGASPTATGITLANQLTASNYIGMRIWVTLAGGGMVFGNIISYSGNPSVVVVDQWYAVPTSSGGSFTGASGTTPTGTPNYVIQDGAPPAWFVGLSTNTTTITTGANYNDTSMSGELTTAGGYVGLARKVAPWGYSSGVANYTLTPQYTVQSADKTAFGTSVTLGTIGCFTSILPTDTAGTLLFETSLSSTAVLGAIGDTLTVTETVSLS